VAHSNDGVAAHPTAPPIKLRPDRLGFDGGALHLDTATFNVATVDDAVPLADHILGVRRAPIEYKDGIT
jgi:hypothetical protein